jgi:hypothetical protein
MAVWPTTSNGCIASAPAKNSPWRGEFADPDRILIKPTRKPGSDGRAPHGT